MERILYFAYGSNLWTAQMKKRCPDSTFVAIGSLADHKLVFDGYDSGRAGAIANVVPSIGDVVWGVVYSLTPHDLELLDGFEDYPVDYQRKTVNIQPEDGTSVSAVVYFRTQQTLGEPNAAYAKIIIDGAREHHLPRDYVDTYLSHQDSVRIAVGKD